MYAYACVHTCEFVCVRPHAADCLPFREWYHDLRVDISTERKQSPDQDMCRDECTPVFYTITLIPL